MQSLINKTLDKTSIKALLENRFKDHITTLKEIPRPATLANLTLIAQRIKVAILEQKKIAIVGDYDVDGVVSCAILKEFFEKIPYPLEIIIPNRFVYGYGISKALIQDLDVQMIITVDNGINAIEAANFCKQKGIELIITDHHTPQKELPDALICNPKLSPEFIEKEICGACVAWYLCASIKEAMKLEISMAEFLDLLALAIVSDVMPLRGINWVLLKRGLRVLKESKRVAFVLLKEHFKKHRIDSRLLGYYIAPLLNAAGRMQSAMQSFQFLIQKDSKKALVMLEELLALNAKRKALQHTIYLEAKAQFFAQKDYLSLPFIVVHNASWSEGVIGIVAAMLYEEFLKPAIVLSKEGNLKGSMRGVNCMEILESHQQFLEGFGGHSGAAGVALKEENLEHFKNALMQNKQEEGIKEKALEGGGVKEVLGNLPFGEIDEELFLLLEAFEPYGYGNTLPKFLAQARVREVRIFGDYHSSIILENNGISKEAVMFNKDLSDFKNQEVLCSFSIYKNNYHQRLCLQLEGILSL
ncbi:single-stranded-DNA-specific exonuclease RecJ [Helicobacter mesocricetorum]|uniref:single-stranded-DNA-specific exonuclease RecJ n=1 Tax=Helicobacter mesocricetorum TaxID=87012 RepID=UPI000CF1744F|nr:single-stranded-DNA-specific exonuclease RecJ [Helicobacter mesocricetorum]